MFDSLSFFELYIDSLISSSKNKNKNKTKNRACIRIIDAL